MNDGTDLAGIDERVRLVSREQARSRLGIATSDLLVLTPGTLWPIKGQALLVDALAQIAEEHPQVRLAFVGQQDPDYAKGVRDLAAYHGLDDRVRIATFTGGTDEWYRAADVVAVPSVSESLPAVALEAMAYRSRSWRRGWATWRPSSSRARQAGCARPPTWTAWRQRCGGPPPRPVRTESGWAVLLATG